MEVTVFHHRCRAALAALAISAFVVPASAQERPAGTVVVGYAALKDTDIDGLFATGWVADISGRVSRSIDLVGEVGGSYKSIAVPDAGFDTQIRIHTFAGGPRWVMRPAAKVTAYVQGLAGGARLSVGISDCGLLPEAICSAARDFGEARTFVAIQPGGGVDVAIAGRVGLRLAGDYRAIFVTDDDLGDDTVLHEFRFAAGIVLGFGR